MQSTINIIHKGKIYRIPWDYYTEHLKDKTNTEILEHCTKNIEPEDFVYEPFTAPYLERR